MRNNSWLPGQVVWLALLRIELYLLVVDELSGTAGVFLLCVWAFWFSGFWSQIGYRFVSRFHGALFSSQGLPFAVTVLRIAPSIVYQGFCRNVYRRERTALLGVTIVFPALPPPLKSLPPEKTKKRLLGITKTTAGVWHCRRKMTANVVVYPLSHSRHGSKNAKPHPYVITAPPPVSAHRPLPT